MPLKRKKSRSGFTNVLKRTTCKPYILMDNHDKVCDPLNMEALDASLTEIEQTIGGENSKAIQTNFDLMFKSVNTQTDDFRTTIFFQHDHITLLQFLKFVGHY